MSNHQEWAEEQARKQQAKPTQFKIGDVVRLKSGGPAMTVNSPEAVQFDGKTRVRCIWFKDGAGPLVDSFHPEQLVPAATFRQPSDILKEVLTYAQQQLKKHQS